MKNQRIKTIAYWITTILGPASFVIGGVMQIVRPPEVAATLTHLGYPLYFGTILGVWKILGAIAVVIPRFPRLKEWAYAGFFFDLTAAAATRAFVGDSAGDIIGPLIFLALVVASWALRPASRKVGTTTHNAQANLNVNPARRPIVNVAQPSFG
jgi:uncharacterized membrane protein YphA (DoxX/SURF4 family)